LRGPGERYNDDWRVGSGIKISIHPGPASFQIRHLNRMRAHVRAQMQVVREGRRLRARFQEVSFRIDRVNQKYQSGRYNPIRLKSEVHELRVALHRIERDLRLRGNRIYIWR
jgi:hypothetical protein